MTQRNGQRQNVHVRSTFYGVLCIAAILALGAGCGKKSHPRAPELAIPERINDLKAAAGEKGISLTWTRPKQYVDGKSLTDLAGFVLFRKSTPTDCPDCQAPYRERIVINVEDQDKFIKTTRYAFRDRELEANTTYRYRIFSRLLDDSLSEPSNEVIVEWKP